MPDAASSIVPALAPRERILATAARLFYARGVRATGVDQLIAEAGVAKATFYYHFPAKEALVRAYLKGRHDKWMSDFEARLAKTKTRGLAGAADALEAWFRSGDFNGCAFINIVAESSEPEWREIACAHKEALRDVLARRLPPHLAAPKRSRLSAQALIVVEGMIVRHQMTRDATETKLGAELLARLDREAAAPRQPGRGRSPLGSASAK